MKRSRAGHEMLVMQLAIADGDYEGKYIWEYLLIKHPKDDVREMAWVKLQQWVLWAGLPVMTHPDELLMARGWVNLAVRSYESDSGERRKANYIEYPLAAPEEQAAMDEPKESPLGEAADMDDVPW